MRILFDHNVPAPLAGFLASHDISKAKDAGWDRLDNGRLLAAAEQAGFEVFVTADKNIRYQQNLGNRRIAIIVLGSSQWPALRPHVGRIASVVNAAKPGGYVEIEIPFL